MARMNVARWRSWLALLAAAAVVPACNMSGTGGAAAPGGGPLWANQTGGPGAATPAGLIWRDVNLGPISGGGGLGGDMTFETAGEIDITNKVATTNPFKGDIHPVSNALPQGSVGPTSGTQEENALQSIVLTWYQTFTKQQSLGNLGNGQNLGFGGGLQLTAPLGYEPKISLEARADCQNCAIQMTTNPSENAINPPNTLTWRLIKCGVNPQLTGPYSGGPLVAPDAQTAFNNMGTGLTAKLSAIQGSGYFGTGFWSLNGSGPWYYAAVVIDLPLGQTP